MRFCDRIKMWLESHWVIFLQTKIPNVSSWEPCSNIRPYKIIIIPISYHVLVLVVQRTEAFTYMPL
jgi:hypothetical protein